MVQSPSMVQRRQPIIAREYGKVKKNRKFAEVAGGTAAECAVVWCCCPCAVVNLAVLVVCKVPAGLCKKALCKQRKRHLIARRKQVGGLLLGPTAGSSLDEIQMKEFLGAAITEENENVLDLDKEMWEQFHGAGFWRSLSQKEVYLKK